MLSLTECVRDFQNNALWDTGKIMDCVILVLINLPYFLEPGSGRKNIWDDIWYIVMLVFFVVVMTPSV